MTDRRDPPRSTIVFNLWIEGSTSVATSHRSAALRCVQPPLESIKTFVAAGELLNHFSLSYLVLI
jgi:hypothetical protein